MTPEQFESRALACNSREEVENLKANALARGWPDLAEIAQRVLSENFPVKVRKGGGATPSHATFKGKSASFDSGKDGYVWLVNQFGLYNPSLFAEYEDFHRKRESAGCRLARAPEALFPEGSNRSATASNYAAVSVGWYVDANLNHAGKFALLLQLGYLARLEYPTEWNLQVEGSIEELADRQRVVLRARELLAELLAR
jgi:hypothetical protein